MSPSLADDRRYCRTVLPVVSRTFAINIRLLAGPLGEAVRAGYLLCRAADALEDSWPGPAEEMRARFDRFLGAVAGDGAAGDALARDARALGGARADLALVAELPRVLRVQAALDPEARDAVALGVSTLASGMRRYASRAAERAAGVPYLDTEAELHDYCYVVAGCVGEMLTRLWHGTSPGRDRTLDARRLALAPRVGEALQLTNILLDWPVDVRRGRCHVPAAWLAETGIEPADLVGSDRPDARALARRMEALARAALAEVPAYLALIPGRAVRYRLFCLWPALWAKASLDLATGDPEFPWGPRRPKLPRSRLWSEVAGSVLDPGRPRSLAAPVT
jgi:farnesyl-diphosphate farnesyltransferase